PQTPGELRGRSARMAEIRDAGEVEAARHALAPREDGPFVVKLAREPGRRESRYAHLFGGPIEASVEPEYVDVPATAAPSLVERIEALERQVAELQAALPREGVGGGSEGRLGARRWARAP